MATVYLAQDLKHRRLVAIKVLKPELTAAAGDTLTGTGIAIGTPGYMSPEQTTGAARLDGRSDIYSLACVLYEMLAGEPPFAGPTAQAIIARAQTEAPRPIHHIRAVPQ